MKGVKKIGVLTILIFLLSLIYFNSLKNGYHFDDYHHIVDNPHLKNIRNISSFFVDTTKFSKTGWQNHYRPLLLVTYALNYYYGRLQPAGYHVVNLAFHVGSAFLVFLIVEVMLISPTLSLPLQGGVKKGGGSQSSTVYFIPLVSALIFAVHPFNSEVVNYISARSSVMSAFFYLLAFYFWVKFREKGVGKEDVPSTVYYIVSLLVFLLGMLTKEVVITLPVMLWLYDLYFYRPLLRTQAKACDYPLLSTVYPCLPFVLLVAFPYIVLSRHLTEGLLHQGGLPRSYYVNLLTETTVLTRYIQMLFTPVNLSVDHVVQNARHFWEWKVVASTGFLAGILILSLWLYRRGDVVWRTVSFFIVWFFVMLLPTTIIPLDAMLQENRGYLAGIGFAITMGLIIWKVAGGEEKLEVRSKKSEVRRYVCIAFTGILIVVFSIMTIQRNRIWKDELTLWTDTVSKYPMSARAHFALGNFYKRSGDTAIAIELYRKVIDLDADYYEAHNNLGVLYFKEGAIDPAIEEFKKALSSMPAHLNARMGLGKALMKKGEMEMAEREFEAAIALARFTHQDTVVEDAMSYLEWIKKRTVLGEIKQ